MSSSEILYCKECGRIFDTIESLNEHQESEKEEEMLRQKSYVDG
ncbi:MAG TPA: hypothetical protein VFR94_24935 [Nitrososphaeraceae archaeon]|nr:hypothetical protein [Nitrososphaeraceae archaeon]